MLLLLPVEISLLIYCIILLLAAAIKKNELIVQRRLESLLKNSVELRKKSFSVNEYIKPRGGLSTSRGLLGGRIFSRLSHKLEMSGAMLKVEEFLLIWGGAAVLPAFLAKAVGADLLTIAVLVLAGFIIPPMVIERKKTKRMNLLDAQLSEALVVICNCLRGGFSFNQAMESIVNEMPVPISKEFGKAVREMKLGVSMDKALSNMVARLKNENLELLVSTINIQRQVGGNLSEILENISTTLKERIRVKGEIKVLTATGRMSGIIIGLLPVLMLAALMLINPSYVRLFFETPLGMVMLCFGVVMELIGFLAVRKIVNITF